jgi:hypothetical protein
MIRVTAARSTPPSRWFQTASSLVLQGSSQAYCQARLKTLFWKPIGNMPPTEAEERYYTKLDAPAVAA